MVGTAVLVGAIIISLGALLGVAWTMGRLLRPFRATDDRVSARERLLRAVPALLAAVIAFVAAARVNADASFQLGGGVTLIFIVAGIASMATAIGLVRIGQASSLPQVAGLIAAAAGALVAGSAPISFAKSVCACTSPATPYVSPTLLGMDAVTWAVISIIATPALLLIAFARRP
jgi:hypothetical protein